MTNLTGVNLAAAGVEKGGLKKLKPGSGLSRQEVATDQKLRLRIALSSLIAESGYEAVTVRGLMRRAQISSSTFYNHYDGVDDCFASMVGSTIRGIAIDLERAQDLDRDVDVALHKTVQILMDSIAVEPQVAQAVFIEAFAAGPGVLDELSSAVDQLEEVIARLFATAPRPFVGTTHLAAGMVAGAFGIVRRTVLTGRARELPVLSDELTDWMLSVANEEVVAFLVPRSRSVDGIVGDRLSLVGAQPASRESVADAGRRAIMTAARLAATDGLSGLTSARIRQDAGLSRREFERHFTGVEDCFLDAIESIVAAAGETAARSATDTGSWERWIYKMIVTLCSMAAGEPNLARLVLLDFTAPGREGVMRRDAVVARIASRLEREAVPKRRASELGATASVCAIWRIAETEAAARRISQLPRIASVFAFLVLASRRPGPSLLAGRAARSGPVADGMDSPLVSTA